MGPPRLVKWRHDPCPDHRQEAKGVGEGGVASCRREEKEEVKISHGIDRDKGKANQEGEMENGKER